MTGPIPIGVVTVSDRASRGICEDRGGPAIEARLARALATPWRAERRLPPDERAGRSRRRSARLPAASAARSS